MRKLAVGCWDHKWSPVSIEASRWTNLAMPSTTQLLITGQCKGIWVLNPDANCGFREPSKHNVTSSQAATAFFTSINQVPAQLQACTSNQKARSRGIDRDTIYELHENTILERSSPKRRKLISAIPTELTTSSDVALSDLPKEIAQHYFQDRPLTQRTPDAGATQLSTPPASKKKQKTKKQITSRVTQRWSDYAISKPINPNTMWTTTEDAVKTAAYKSIAKTTLEKLAVFRNRDLQSKVEMALPPRSDNLATIQQRHNAPDEKCHAVFTASSVVVHIVLGLMGFEIA